MNHQDVISRGALFVKYEYVGEYDRNGIAVAQTFNGLMCHIDRAGHPLYKEKYLRVSDFSDGLAVAEGKKGFRHIRPDGTSLYLERYAFVTPFSNGTAIVVAQGFKEYWHIGTNGKKLYDAPFQFVYEFMNGVAIVQTAQKWFLIGMDGRRVGDEEFEDVQTPGIITFPLRPFAKKDGKCFRINLDGTRAKL